MLKALFPQSYERYIDYLPLLLIAAAISFVITPFVGFLARKMKVIAYPPSMRKGDKPSDFRHLEKPPTPLFGGIAVLLPLIVLSLIHTGITTINIYFLIGIGIILIGGILDDKFELPYSKQIIFQLIAAVLIVISPLNLDYVSNPFNGTFNLNWWQFTQYFGNILVDVVIPGDLIFFAWIIICINAVKWVSGTDGLMEGNSFFASLALFVLSIRIENYSSATISILFSGLILGFLFYNFHPARIRSGSSGKTAYGFILAVLSMMSGAKITLGIIILMIPLLDFIWVIVGRIKKHQPRNISSLMQISDKTHLHHRLLSLGLSETQIALVEYLLSAIMAVTALALSGARNAFIILGSFVMLIILAIGGFYLINKRLQKMAKAKEESPESKYSY